MNVVPKEGGNTFRTIVSGMFANPSFESTNLTDELRQRGLTTSNKTIKLFDEALSVGGPIKRDHLWFFVAPRSWGLARSQAGTYWNKTQSVHLTPPGAERTVVLWTPWVDRPEDRLSGRLEWYDSILTRITWQASQKNKVNVTYDEQRACNCGSVSAAQSHEYYLSSYRFEPNRLFQTTWTSTVTSRLLLEAGMAATISQWNMYYNPGVTNDIISISDSVLGISYGAPTVYLGHPNSRDRYTQRASLAYVTGSHNFKTGFSNERPMTKTYYHTNGFVNYTFRNGVPNSITQYASPYLAQAFAKWDLGIFAQDQWKVSNRLTLNLGIRWDYFNSYTPEQTAGFPDETDGYFAGFPTVNPWIAPRRFDPVYNAPNWKDWDPRVKRQVGSEGSDWPLRRQGRYRGR
jgi:outer membrane receptor protein involved in Fe transport